MEKVRVKGIKIIGKQNCSRCDMVKGLFDKHCIRYEYEMMEDLTSEEQKEYRKMAILAKQMEMPLVIVDGKIVSVEELV